MNATFLVVFLVLAPTQTPSQISAVQKNEFLELLNKLPVKGEFYTDDAIEKSGSYLPVLFSLTENDIEKYDIYLFVALSRGLCDRKKHRDYAVHHFNEIQHPVLKLGWGVMLFNKEVTSPTIVQFLKNTIKSPQQAKLLSEMLGPEYEDFKRRVMK